MNFQYKSDPNADNGGGGKKSKFYADIISGSSQIGVDSGTAATCSISIAIWPQVLLVVGGAGRGDLQSMGDATPDPYRHLSCGMHKHCS